MKKNLFVGMLLALMLMTGALGLHVLAETREETIMLEGEAEFITTTLHKSEALGYAMWYDAELFSVSETEGVDLYMPISKDAPKGISLRIERREQGVDFGEIRVEFAEKMEKEYRDFNDFGSANELFVSVRSGTQTRILSGYTSNRYEDVYLVDEGKQVYILTIDCPTQAEEGFGSRIRQMLKSFQPF